MIKFFIHITLAFTLLFSSTGFWTFNHYCQNELVKTSFLSFGSCCAGDASKSCDADKKSCSQEDEDDCCDNKSSYHKLDQNQFINKIEFKSLEDIVVVKTVTKHVNTDISLIDKKTLQYFNYVGPPIVFDYQVELQTFLC